MSARNIDSLEQPREAEATALPVTGTAVAVPSAPVLADINYPDPTPLAQILRDVSKWSGVCFVLEPTGLIKLQIFAPHRLPVDAAYELFLASLSVVGLRAVQTGKIVKIVPVTLVVAA